MNLKIQRMNERKRKLKRILRKRRIRMTRNLKAWSLILILPQKYDKKKSNGRL